MCLEGHVVGFRVSESKDSVSTEPGDPQSYSAPGHTEKYALGEDLADDPDARRAERHSDCNIGTLGGGARQQEAGNVRTGDEEDDAGENHKQAQICAGLLLKFLDAAPCPG